MTTTDKLIRRLAAEAKPVPRAAALRRLSTGLVFGLVVSSAAIFASLGPPLQAVQHTGATAFAMKLLFSVALFGIGLVLLFVAGRPGHEVRKHWLSLFIPPAVVAISAAMELAFAAPYQRQAIWLGSTWQNCFAAIILLSLPVFAGIVWALQRLGPTRLTLAGLLAGLTAGSAGAVLYALYCPETNATFLLSWYSLGILTVGLIGLAAGPRLLKW